MANPHQLYIAPGSAPCRAVLYHLHLTGMRDRFDVVEVDLQAGEQRTPEFLAMNPRHCVPTMRLANGRVLWESRAIMGALDGFDDWEQVASRLQWLDYDLGTLYPAISGLVYPIAFDGRAPDDPASHYAMAELVEEIAFLEAHFSDGRNFVTDFGDSWCGADISMAMSLTMPSLVLGRAGMLELMGAAPHVNAWAGRVANLDPDAWREVNAPFYAWRQAMRAA